LPCDAQALEREPQRWGHREKNILATVALLGLAAPAIAADMAVKARPMVAPMAYSWTGFYVGGNVGYGWLRSTEQIAGADPASVAFIANNTIPTSIPLDSSGVLGGGQVGYNWQFAPNWVAGIEADIAAADFRQSTTVPNPLGGRPMSGSESLNWIGTVRGRVGFVPMDRLLVYGTGGFAYGDGSLSAALSNINGCVGNNCQRGSVSGTLTGWAAGVGAEWAFANNWSARVEYLHYDLGSLSHRMVDPPFVFVFDANANFRGDIVRVGLNLKLGAGAVVAKY
jgi:outer membrane immunogenic protein